MAFKAALYAEDLVLWCKEEHASTTIYIIQQAIDQLTSWTEDWCVTVNKDTSSTTLFTLPPKKQASPIKIGTHTLIEEDEATYLGVTFDKTLTWKPHTLRTEGKGSLQTTTASWRGLGRIDNSELSTTLNAWMFQHDLIVRLIWQLMIYAIPISTVVKLEQLFSKVSDKSDTVSYNAIPRTCKRG